MSLRKQAEEALQNPNVKLFLDLLAEAEGASLGYNTLFGGSAIPSLDDHPRITQDYFNPVSKKTERSSAAGRYQFKISSWDEQADRLGLTDFSPESQDLAAIGLMMYKPKALEALKKGDFASALKAYGPYWASLPSSPYAQPRRSQEWIQQTMQSLRDSDLRAKHLQIASQYPSQTTPPAPEPWQGVPFPITETPPPVESLGQFVDDAMAVSQTSSILDNPLVVASIDADAERARNEAVAAFTGKPLRHDLDLPKAIEASIRKLLVDL